MFNPEGKAAIPLTNFGGLVAEADAAALPEGSSPLCWDNDFLVGSVKTRPGLAPVYAAISPAQNFIWIKSFRDSANKIHALMVDAAGDLYVEHVTDNPGVLALLQSGFAAGQTVSGCAAFSRMYMALSPSGMPWQYDGTYLDRVSQEGPGGNAFYTVNTVNTTSAQITAFAITSNVVTFTAANAFTAGQLVVISGLAVGTYLNGQVLVVSSTGLSSTQFEASFTHADVTSTNDSGVATAQNSFPISTITQYKPFGTANGDPNDTAIYQWAWSAGPGTTQAGSVVTIYIRYPSGGSFPNLPDQNFINAWKAGIPIYVVLSGLTGDGSQFNGIQLVTGVGYALGGQVPGRSLGAWYFTFAASSPGGETQNGPSGSSYQMTLATLTMSSPVPGVQIGDSITITGAAPSAWNRIWTVAGAPQNGILSITQTSATGGVATYTFSQVSGAAPAIGDLVTITNTFNGNGVFNVTDSPVASVVGSTFTIINFPQATIAAQVENGQAQLSGNIIMVDPGPLYYGQPSAGNPIYGNSTVGGDVVLAPGISQSITPGTRQAVVIFKTRQGFLPKPSPPVTFTTLQDSNSITSSSVPVGPPNVIERWIAFTEAGQEGSPGAFFYVIPDPVLAIVNGQQVTYSSTVIKDNVSTSATFTFTDNVLLSALEIDVQGNDLFNLIELGSSQWCFAYAQRMLWGGEQNKVYNFLNLTFNGGYVPTPGQSPYPLGWTSDATFGIGVAQLKNASVAGSFGSVLYILNSSGSTQTTYGMNTQGAYQDSLGVAILEANTAYSVRVTARIPSGNTAGNLVVDLVRFSTSGGYGNSLGSYTIPFSSLKTSYQVLSGSLMAVQASIPSDLVLRFYCTGIANGADIEIDRIEIFPTNQPVLTTNVRASYVDNPESFDIISGNLSRDDNPEPFVGAFEMYDQLYLEKPAARYSTRDVANAEPDGWSIREVSNRTGSFGPAAFDVGEEWQVSANRDGVYIFSGRQPVKISQEIWRLWEYVNFAAASTVWVRNDTVNRRILVGVPMKTPNPWLPNDPIATPTSPSHILMLNYLGLDDVTRLEESPQMHTTIFGNLVSVDMRRKWSPWHIACPYADFILRQDGVSRPLFLCCGDSSGNIYQLLDASLQPSDNGKAVNFFYTTSAIPDLAKEKQFPQLGNGRKLWTYMQMLAQGGGTLTVAFLPNTLYPKYSWTVPSGIPMVAHPTDDYERPLNVSGNRVYAQFSHNASGIYADVSRLIMYGAQHPTLAIRGSASQGAR